MSEKYDILDCIKVHSQIKKYIDKELPRDELEGFIDHIKNCPDCQEELKISYTLDLGMRQLEDYYEDLPELEDVDQTIESRIRYSVMIIKRQWAARVLRYSVYTLAFWSVVFAFIVQVRMFLEAGIL